MADLQRLSSIAADMGSPAPVIAAVLNQVGVSEGPDGYLSSLQVGEAVAWLAASPDFVVPGLVPQHVLDYVRRVAPSLKETAGVCDDVAYYARHLNPASSRYTREARNVRVADIANNRKVKQGHVALGPVETAVLDLVTRVGYTNLAGAVATVSRLRQVGIITQYVVEHKQLECAVFRVVCSCEMPGRDPRPVITPWCVSRQAAVGCAGVYLAAAHRHLAAEAVKSRSVTVASHMARVDIESVRTIVGPAIRLITTLRFNPTTLSLESADGRPREHISSRAPHTTIAFAYLVSRGAVDVLDLQSRLRCDVAPSPGLMDPSVGEYYFGASDVQNTLLLASRSLFYTRWRREQPPLAHDFNKGECLGYLAGGRTKKDRNTASCVNRIQEAICTVRSLGQDPGSLLFVVEWGGAIDSAVVLSFCSLARVDCAVDVAASGIDVGGRADPKRAAANLHFTALMRYKVGRTVPVVSEVPYGAEDGVSDRVRAVVGAVGDGCEGFVYLSGGLPAVSKMSAPQSVDDVRSDVQAALMHDVDVPCVLAASDFIMPPACPHLTTVDADEFVRRMGQVDSECGDCTATMRHHATIASLLSLPGVRLSKTRSAFAHNLHFDIEYSSLFRDVMDHTGRTCDSVVFSSGMRNYYRGDRGHVRKNSIGEMLDIPAAPAEGFRESMLGVRQGVYEVMAGVGGLVRAPVSDAFSDVVRSVG